MYSPSIKKLIAIFGKFPTVGQRTAARFAFYLLRLDNAKTKELIEAIVDLKKNVKVCPRCFNVHESENEFCAICSDSKRDRRLLCVVANETDLLSIEATKKYAGFYFVLGGSISGPKDDNLRSLRISQLEKLIKTDLKIGEIILAINPTSEGQATVLYLSQTLKPLGKKITKLGLGLPLGGELEYADEETLISALEGRK